VSRKPTALDRLAVAAFVLLLVFGSIAATYGIAAITGRGQDHQRCTFIAADGSSYKDVCPPADPAGVP
jgi:hypothetical protein